LIPAVISSKSLLLMGPNQKANRCWFAVPSGNVLYRDSGFIALVGFFHGKSHLFI